MSRPISLNRAFAIAMVAATSFIGSGVASATGISTAQSVVPEGYTPGDFSPTGTSTTFQNSSAALGALNGDTGYGGLTPFNPPYAASHIVGVGAGGSLTLQLSEPVPATGRTLGVFANNGVIDVSSDASGQAGNPAATFSPLPRAVVSVSYDGVNFNTLNGGAPITFDNPTNYYLDAPIVAPYQMPGTQVAAQQKPFLGNLASFNGQAYTQIKTTLNGSAGGTWIDTSAAALPAINYVRFDVPAGSSDRLIVDSVAGMTAAEPIVANQPVIFESVGTGANRSNIVVDFGLQSFEFAVHYDGSITGMQALQLLEDNSLFEFGTQTFSFGELVSELDYGGFDFAGTGSTGSDYWSYYVGDASSWGFSGQGAGQRLLTDGSYDGWVWAGSQSTAPDRPVAVPEPASLGMLAAAAGATLLRRRRQGV
jgi:hypothetical protein